jgi:hypothetical protein
MLATPFIWTLSGRHSTDSLPLKTKPRYYCFIGRQTMYWLAHGCLFACFGRNAWQQYGELAHFAFFSTRGNPTYKEDKNGGEISM